MSIRLPRPLPSRTRGAPVSARVSALTLTVLLATACARGPRYAAQIPPLDARPTTLIALQSAEIAVGTGTPMRAGACAFVHYTGWLTNGTKFDSSRDTTRTGQPRDPISFPQGFRRVIAGWDLGFEGMRVGGKRRLIIPHQLGYGERDRPPIPPKSTLIFDVELMAVADTLPRPDSAPRGAGTAPPCPTWASVKSRG